MEILPLTASIEFMQQQKYHVWYMERQQQQQQSIHTTGVEWKKVHVSFAWQTRKVSKSKTGIIICICV